MKTDELRQLYLDFFKGKGHTLWPSDTLVPSEDDQTVLFTPAGMNQFKDMFAGRRSLGFTRAATSQKCLRTGDIENVGKTPVHHTFFEMLGNFSFGDYFKREAIEWAWEFVVEVLKFDETRLYASVHMDDDEAFDIWNSVIGIPKDEIRRYDDKENFWPANAPKDGPNGPCGPCSEIFYDHGDEYGCGKPECDLNCDCRRYVEIWNLVFTQFERKDGGVLDPLPSKNIDTGMGLERTAAVLQGCYYNFDIDILRPIVDAACKDMGIEYDQDTVGPSVRRIADHVRAVTFCIADGVLPSNEGRGYIERRLIRRAVRDGVQLGMNDAFLYRLVPVVAELMGGVYPEVAQRADNIARIIQAEEDRFHQTLDQGNRLLEDLTDKMRKSGETVLKGGEAFRLYDTYGFPLEMTEAILEEQGLSVDREGFDTEMERQREQARAASGISTEVFDTGPVAELKGRSQSTAFLGYEQTSAEGKVVGIIRDDALVDDADTGQEITVVLDRTPFYGEAGGQVGDTGVLIGKNCCFAVRNTKKTADLILHVGEIESGSLSVGDAVTAEVDCERRMAIMRNHTATHLLHYALRQVLGERAEQSGSLVASHRLRFDFTHFEAVSDEELAEIERIVNDKILAAAPVEATEMSLDEARAAGAIALFGEKYGAEVRLVNTGGFSKELCGGTHLYSTGPIGSFRILREQSVAAGIRRIEAVTGQGALDYVNERLGLLRDMCRALNVQEADVVKRAESLVDEAKALRKQIQELKKSGGPAKVDALEGAEKIGDITVVCRRVDGASGDDMRTMTDQIRQSAKSAVILLGAESKGKAVLVAAATPDAVKKGIKAGDLVKEAASICGGGGGGRPDMAQGGGPNATKLDAALEGVAKTIRETLDSA